MPTGMSSSSSSSIHSTKYTPLFSPENSNSSTSSSAPSKRSVINSLLSRPNSSPLAIVLLCLVLLSATLVLIVRIGISINTGLFLSNSSTTTTWVQVDFFCHIPPLLNDSELFCSAAEFQTLLEANPPLIVLEPDYLVNVALLKRVTSLSRDQKAATLEELRAQWDDFRWRFSLPASFGHQRNSLTVGLLATGGGSSSVDDALRSLNLGNFSLVEAVHGPIHHQPKTNSTLHLFFRRQISAELALHLHIVVLHPVEQEYLWLGAIPNQTVRRLGAVNSRAHPETSWRLHFGLHEAEHAFDLLAPVQQVMAPLSREASHDHHQQQHNQHPSISVPEDIEHYLSQVLTSRYLYCPPERASWFATVNRTINERKETVSAQAFREMKAFARHLRMQVWIACGTLLGWYRQCHVTPYTSDTDFATWSRYLYGRKEDGGPARDLGPVFQAALDSGKSGTQHLKLYQRFGEPTATMEYSFVVQGEKVDLFVLYSNGSHLLVPFHVPSSRQYSYNVYPHYQLCSGAFLGVRLLVPCTPLEIILAEYGSTWKKVDDDYSYITSPKNTAGPLMHYNFSGEQHAYY